jgi:hypothetical protein
MVRFGRAAIKRTLIARQSRRQDACRQLVELHPGANATTFSHQSQMQTINEGPRESWGTLRGYLVVTASEELQQTEAVAERIGH